MTSSPSLPARAVRLADRLLGRLRDLCSLLGSLALVLLIAIFGWLVFGRYVLNATPTWVEQLALVLVCYITFLGAAAGVRDDTHLGVTFLRESMPRGLRRALRVLADAALAVFGVVMLSASADLVAFGWSTKIPMLNVPEGIRTFAAAVAGGLIAVFAAARAGTRIHRYWIAPARAAAPVGEGE
ncbi:hypothetical protein LNKW23_18780 [Paralimibaculum aggregatum]|uniref:TRAP transporter small permease protein n=1 Tax=Paralimibaculum aggregatum TaxID=3036245 RepID=A0ABQ6LHA4_9RHOB|nr:TRAP transporter small permease [Limibaculum sp. NKW23]GMG82665.1 hypothetical protein LNKW23_18780 [Limibaculum sp. NKW23]